MKDIKKMWMVTSDLNKFLIDALFDKDNGKVTHFRNNDEDDFYLSSDRNYFFSLEKEADEYIQQRLQFLKEKDEEVISLIEEMYFIEKENDAIKYKFKTLENMWVWCQDRGKERMEVQKENDRYANIVRRLCHALRSGYLNIDANTFQVKDVAQIKWFSCGKDEKGKKESVQLTLSNGKVLDINKHTELEILKYIYGDNESGYVYSKLDK